MPQPMADQSRSSEPLRFVYRFEFDDAPPKAFEVLLDPDSLELIRPESPAPPPDWTALEVGQCEGCPLHVQKDPVCPVATALVEVVEFFADAYSHEEALVTVVTRERTYSKRCALQIGISSLMGLIVPTSGCPVADPLRSLVPSHLPFATAYETIPRVAAHYLLQQYHREREGGAADWQLEGLAATYSQLEKLNHGLGARICSQQGKDASRNAVVHLGVFAGLINFSIGEDTLREVLESLRRK